MPFGVQLIVCSVSGLSLFAFSDVVTQRVEIKFRKRDLLTTGSDVLGSGSPLTPATSESTQKDTGENHTKPSSHHHAPRSCIRIVVKTEKPKRNIGFSFPRVAKYAAVGLTMGTALPFIMGVAEAVVPGSSTWGELLARALIVETLFVPPAIALSFAVGGSTDPDNPWKTTKDKFKDDYFETLLLHLPFTPCWMLPWTHANLPFPGFSARIPAAVILAFTQLCPMGFLSYRSFRRPGTRLRFQFFFSMGDLFSRYTLAAITVWIGGGYINCLGQIIAEGIGKRGLMWDPLFPFLPHVPSAGSVDFLIGTSVAMVFGHMFLRTNPPLPVVLRRLWTIQGALLFVRGFTVPMFAPFLASPDFTCVSNVSGPFFLAAFSVEAGIGHTCNDLMFSGHSVYFILAALYFQDYTKNRTWKTTFWVYTVGCLLMVIATHVHYTADVVAAFFITAFFWEEYHKLLTVDTSNELDDSFRVKVARAIKYISHDDGIVFSTANGNGTNGSSSSPVPTDSLLKASSQILNASSSPHPPPPSTVTETEAQASSKKDDRAALL